ncbi:MAG TPA: hypothetical protein VFE46_06175 [Pirellulales bacterium]|jgi:hypothetical protein|nr:hypothetical protein [Pirellulales bacterium]
MAKKFKPFVPSADTIISQSQTATAATNTVVNINLAAVTNEVRGIDMVDAGYDSAAAAGTLTITIGSTVVYHKDFVGTMPTYAPPRSLYIPPNTTVTISLTAASGAVGHINMVQHPANLALARVNVYPHRTVLSH